VAQAQTSRNSKEGANEIGSQQLIHIRKQPRSLALAVPQSFTDSKQQQQQQLPFRCCFLLPLSDLNARQVQLSGNSKNQLTI